MISKQNNADVIEYNVGEKWMNTERGKEFYITEISETLVSADDKKGDLGSICHEGKMLFRHLVKVCYYSNVSYNLLSSTYLSGWLDYK